MMSRFYVSALKNVLLEEVEIEAENEQEAKEEYVRWAVHGGIDIYDYQMHLLSVGDTTISPKPSQKEIKSE